MKFYGIDITSCIVFGGISIAAAYLDPLFAAISSGLGWMGLNLNPKEALKKFETLKENEKQIKQSASGILFKYIE